MKYINKYKRKIFPFISDWSDPQDHLRHSNNVKNMPFKEWFWFRPENYHLVNYGFHIFSIISFTLLAMYFYTRFFPVTIVSIIVVLHQTYKLSERLNNHKALKHTNMYDIFMRE